MFCRPFRASNPADRVFFQKGATDVAPYEGGCYGNIIQALARLKPGLLCFHGPFRPQMCPKILNFALLPRMGAG
jgi:hypothetical protein